MSRSLRTISVNSLAQLIGAVGPALLMLAAYPIVKSALGDSQFGTFTALFTTVSLLGVLDAGLGRTITYHCARRLQQGDSRGATQILWHGLLLGVGAIGCVTLFILAWCALFAGPRVVSANSVDSAVVLNIVYFMPVFIAGGLLRGFLDAEQRFVEANLAQLVFGSLVAGLPIVIVRYDTNVGIYPWLFGALRTLQAVIYLALIARSQRGLFHPVRPCRATIGMLLSYSKWLFVSNLVGASIVFADRALVAMRFPADQVAPYLVPMELILRGQVIFTTISTVLFPLLARRADAGHTNIAHLIFALQSAMSGCLIAGAFLIFPAVPWLLTLWMGPAFAAAAQDVFMTSLLGLALIAVANFAVTAVNALGYTDTPALIHVFELPVYLAALTLACSTGRLDLVVLTWLGRLTVDMLAMQWLLLQNMPADCRARPAVTISLAAALLCGSAVAIHGVGHSPPTWLLGGGLLIGGALAVHGWRKGTQVWRGSFN